MRKKLVSLILFFVLSAMLYFVSFLPAFSVANPQTQPSSNSTETSAPFVAASSTQQPAKVNETNAVPTQTASAEPSVTLAPTHPISGTYDMSAEEPDSYKKGMAAYEKQDFGIAVPYLTEAAARGYAPAQYQLGECYRMGAGVKVNEEMAFSLYKLAADQYYANGLLWVGYCYHHGIGVAQDYDLAGEYYVAAQKAGHKNADDRIGELMQDMMNN
jgi:hypothetical protein